MSGLDIVRYVFGIACIRTGWSGVTSGEIMFGIALILFGISLFPIIYKLIKNANEKKLHIIIPILMFILMFICGPESTQEENIIKDETIENLVVENKIENIVVDKQTIEEKINASFVVDDDDKNIEIIKGNSKKIIIEIIPDTIEDEIIEFVSENNEIAYVREFDTYFASGKKLINVYINGDNIGTAKIYATIKDTDIKEEITTITVKEEQKPTPPPTTTTTSSTSATTTTDNSRGVYRTPSGKRYHFDPDCGGKNSYSTTLNKATSAGLTPCQKCAQ